MSDRLPIAAAWPDDLRYALHAALSRTLPLLASLPAPLGWAGSLDDVAAFLGAVPPPPTPGHYSQLADQLGLSATEEFVLLAALSGDLDVRCEAVWQVIGGRIDVTRPRLHGLLQLVPAEDRDAVLELLSPRHPLRLLGLVQVVADGGGLLHRVSAGSAVLGVALGHDVDAGLHGIELSNGHVEPRAVPAAVRAALAAPLARGTMPTAIFIDGAPGSGRGSIARGLASLVERGVVAAMYEPERGLAQIGALARAALARQCLPCLEVPSGADARVALSALGQLRIGPCLVICDGRPALPSPWQTFATSTDAPNLERRRQLWQVALGDEHAAVATDLARRLPLATGAIFRAADEGRGRAGGAVDLHELAQAGRELLVLESNLVERQRGGRRLDDLILPPPTRALLDEIIAFARNQRTVFDSWGFARRMRGGLRVLFSGPPGTGKTMSAEVIAGELDLELFRIDLSNVVSKWVGETEKNLKQVFDQADASGGVLLFDEADSLFGKRTSDVKSSSDRHANLEVNYLLQRMEMFDGIVLLTTNLESGIDEAFRRRLNFRVRFGAPDADERARLWRSMIPTQAPCAEVLAFDDVAERYDMAGGNIKNAALRAAVLAAGEGSALRTRHLLAAAEREYTEIGRIAK